jgi:hypothetical protein
MRRHGKRKKQKTVTFRIDDDIIDKLYDEADTNAISLNSLVNSILRRHMDWGRYEKKSNIISIVSVVIKEAFGYLNKDQVIGLAKGEAKDAVYNTILFMYGKVDFESVIFWFKEKMKNSVGISDKIDVNNGNRIIIFRHDLGEKWSLYNKVLLESICHDILSIPIKVEITISTIKIDIKV